jgi:hypothetical protein
MNLLFVFLLMDKKTNGLYGYKKRGNFFFIHFSFLIFRSFSLRLTETRRLLRNSMSYSSSVALVLVLAHAALQETNAQSDLFVTHSFNPMNARDIASTVAPISSLVAFNNYACMNLCAQNSNCALAVFRTINSNCSLYNSGAQSQMISSSGSILYQRQING